MPCGNIRNTVKILWYKNGAVSIKNPYPSGKTIPGIPYAYENNTDVHGGGMRSSKSYAIAVTHVAVVTPERTHIYIKI